MNDMRMRSSLPVWLGILALAGIFGCGADGGVGGTGISSLTGNVTLQTGPDFVATRSTTVGGIIVAIRGTDLSTMTDSAGYFEIHGSFEGSVTVEFTELDGTVSMLPVSVPSGSTVALRNIRFNQGLASAERIDVLFEGNVTGDAICMGGSGVAEVAEPRSGQTFVVRVNSLTRYESRSPSCPEQPACEDIRPQRTLKISGRQNGDLIDAEMISFVRCRQPRSNR